MKKSISIFIAIFTILCLNGNSYAGGHNKHNSTAIAGAIAAPININEAGGGDAESSSLIPKQVQKQLLEPLQKENKTL